METMIVTQGTMRKIVPGSQISQLMQHFSVIFVYLIGQTIWLIRKHEILILLSTIAVQMCVANPYLYFKHEKYRDKTHLMMLQSGNLSSKNSKYHAIHLHPIQISI